MSPFDRLTPERICTNINGAEKIVVYSCCSLTASIAESLIMAAERIGHERVIVLFDTTEDVLRKGYGEVAGVRKLLSKKRMVLREADGLRINTLICDQSAWVFSLPPMAIESQDDLKELFNAIVLNPQQRQGILDAINPSHNNVELDTEDIDCATPHETPVIGASDVNQEKLMAVVEKVEKNPPQPFDLMRLVNVYQSKIEFVELELKGARINQHRIPLPPVLKALLASDPEAQRRINASYQIIDSQSDVSGEVLNERIKSIRKDYLSNLKGIGTVLLKEHRQSFQQDLAQLEKEVAEFKKNLEKKVGAEISKNIQSLATVFGKLILDQKPRALIHKISGKLTPDVAEQIVVDLLQRVTPSAERLSENIALRCLYKDVTIEMLNNKEFQNQVRDAFSHVEWDLPFEEHVAAPVQQQAKGA